MAVVRDTEHLLTIIECIRFDLQARINLIFDVAAFTNSTTGNDIIKVTIKILEKENNILSLVDRTFTGVMRLPTSTDGFIKYLEDSLKKIYDESEVFYSLMIFSTDFVKKHCEITQGFIIEDPITNVMRINIDDEGKSYQKFFSLTYGKDFNDEDCKNYKLKQMEDFIEEINSGNIKPNK